jgi:hypothetical protein
VARFQISEPEFTRSDPSGVCSEAQLEAILLGFYARALRSRDRRPQGVTIKVNHATGLPEAQGSLLPKHKATSGPELALALIIPPEDFVASIVRTDDLPQNQGKPDHQKEVSALCYKAKDTWSDEELQAVKENARRLKRVVHRLEVEGLFVTRPRLEDCEAELGAKELVHGEDGLTMGFKVTPDGLRVAEDFGRDHPFVMRAEDIEDAMGDTLAARAPEWRKAERRLSSAAP